MSECPNPSPNPYPNLDPDPDPDPNPNPNPNPNSPLQGLLQLMRNAFQPQGKFWKENAYGRSVTFCRVVVAVVRGQLPFCVVVAVAVLLVAAVVHWALL